MPLSTRGCGGGSKEPGTGASLRTPDVELLTAKRNKAKFYSQNSSYAGRAGVFRIESVGHKRTSETQK